MRSFDPTSEHVLLTCAEMGRADAAAIAAGIPDAVLMENAGRAVAEEALARGGRGRAVVLAGPGNNGGDGFVAARHLAAAGLEVAVALLGDRTKLTGVAAAMVERWEGPVEPMVRECLEGADLIVDAVFGAGLTRAVEGRVADVIASANARDALRVAVDVPSGISGDDGQARGTVFEADLTVTFFRKKPGHVLVPGRLYCGAVKVRDIGIRADILSEIAPRAFENRPGVWRLDWPALDPLGHKYGRGHAVVVSGRPPALGATRLAAMAALRTGAGLVTLATPEEAYAIQASALTEVMVWPFAGESAFDALLSDARKTVVALGPGNGADERTAQRVLATLAAGKRVVLDADALTAFEATPERLFDAIAGDVVMTPHGGEFRRLFGETGADKLTATREAAERSGAVVVHKGPDTVVAAPDGRVLVEGRAPAHLATAGSGDVLTGIVAGCLAQGMEALSAAACAVHLHGAAARRYGRGMIAGDLVSALPEALAELDAVAASGRREFLAE